MAARTHPKALFKPTILLIGLVIILAIVTNWWPSWGSEKINSYVFIGIILVWILVTSWYSIVPMLSWYASKFTLTNEKVKIEWGVLYKMSREIDLTRIASISEERGILDRIFGCGTLYFFDAAAGAQPEHTGSWNRKNSPHEGVRFSDVPRVRETKQLVEEARRNAKREYF